MANSFVVQPVLGEPCLDILAGVGLSSSTINMLLARVRSRYQVQRSQVGEEVVCVVSLTLVRYLELSMY